MKSFSIFEATSSKAMCSVYYHRNKFILLIWPKDESGKKKYNWSKRKQFNFEDAEVMIIAKYLDIYFNDGFEKAKSFISMIFGKQKDTPQFYHIFDNKESIAGLDLISNNAETIENLNKKGLSPFRLFVSKDGEKYAVTLTKIKLFELKEKLKYFFENGYVFAENKYIFENKKDSLNETNNLE